MKAIVKLAVVAAILYAAVIYGRPWLEELLGGMGVGELGGGGSPQRACIAAIERANDDFTDLVLRHASPPVDVAKWSSGYRLAEGRMRKAAIACECSEQGCAEARRALAVLEGSMSSTNLLLRSGRPAVDLARDQQEILDLLVEAESMIP